MTLLHEPAAPHAPATHGKAVGKRIHLPLEVAALAVALACFELFVVHAGGGRDDGAVTKGLIGLAPALLLTRPWTRLRPGVLAVAALPALGALFMCVTSPLGWAGADQVATAGYAGLLFMTVAAAGTDRRRSLLVAMLVAGTAVWQCLYAVWVWSAGGDVAKPLIGTYYWHNPFAVHAAVGALVLLAVLVSSTGRTRAVTAGTALCLVATGLSTSRATLLLLAATMAVIILAALLRAGSRTRVLRRLAALAAATVAGAGLLLVPLTVGAESADVGARAADESFASSGSHRLSFYSAALRVIADEPLTGVGVGGFAAAASPHQGPLEARARNVHSGLLQAAVEGGLPLALAYALPLGLLGFAAARRLRHVAGSDVAVLYGATGASVLLVLHSLVDFDWSFPALPVLLGATGGLALAIPPAGRPAPVRPGWNRPAAVGCSLLLLSVVAVSVRADAADAAIRSQTLPTGSTALVGLTGPLRDARFDRLVLSADVARQDLAEAVDASAAAAEHDVTLQFLRARALVRLGEVDAGLALARATWVLSSNNMPLQAPRYAEVLDDAGRSAEAKRVLSDSAQRLIDLGPEGARRADHLVVTLVSRPDVKRSDELDCLILRLNRVHPGSRLQPPTTTPPTCR